MTSAPRATTKEHTLRIGVPTNATLPYARAFADHGRRAALVGDPVLAAGLNVCGAAVTRPGVAAEPPALAFPLRRMRR
jgi:alanine dehydrogenase